MNMSLKETGFRSLRISAIAISSVVFVEVVLGLAVGSLAILSDGVHALLDAILTLILLVTSKAALKPPDEEHMYGHEKIEPIGGLISGVVLLGMTVFLITRAVQRLLYGESLNQEWEIAGFAAIGYTFCIDVLRIKVLRRVEMESVAVKAGFYDALADFGSTLIALLGFGFAVIGFPALDAAASLVLSAAISYLSIRLVKTSGMELSDAVSKDVVDRVRREMISILGASNVKKLRARRVGGKTFIDAVMQVPDYMSLEEAHAVTSQIEERLRSVLGNVEVLIHVEPPERGMLTTKLVEKLAGEVEGVKEIHEVNIAYVHGKLYITLHAYVDPALSVQEAHELAEKIEGKLIERLTNVGNITVHMEPLNTKLQRGPMVNEDEIQQVIYKIAERFQQIFWVKSIVTFVVGGKRYINIDCYFIRQASIEEAHEIASKIENEVKQRFTETIVTVHMEPKKDVFSTISE